MASKYDADGNLYPTDPEERGKVDQKMFHDMHFFNKAREHYFAKYFGTPDDAGRFPYLEKQMQFLDIALEEHPYVAGDTLTIADFSVMSTVTFCKLAKFPVQDYPNVTKWMELCSEEVPGIFIDEEFQDSSRAMLDNVNGEDPDPAAEEGDAPEEVENVCETTVEDVE